VSARRAWTLLLILAATACTSEAPARDLAALARARRCDLPRPPDADEARAAAGRCAEAFVARNGYLDALPADDTTFVVGETDTAEARSALDLVRERRATLAPAAIAICEIEDPGPGWVVRFQRRGDPREAAVMMRQDFTEMRLVPDASGIVPIGGWREGACAAPPGAESPR